MWHSEGDGLDYSVSKVYSEIFSPYAMLRSAGVRPEGFTIGGKVSKGHRDASLSVMHLPKKGRFRSTSQFLPASSHPNLPGSRAFHGFPINLKSNYYFFVLISPQWSLTEN